MINVLFANRQNNVPLMNERIEGNQQTVLPETGILPAFICVRIKKKRKENKIK